MKTVPKDFCSFTKKNPLRCQNHGGESAKAEERGKKYEEENDKNAGKLRGNQKMFEHI